MQRRSMEKSPPGFAAVVLIDESHVTAHCYSERGILAIDVFTCGKHDPDILADSTIVPWFQEIPILGRLAGKGWRGSRSEQIEIRDFISENFSHFNAGELARCVVSQGSSLMEGGGYDYSSRSNVNG